MGIKVFFWILGFIITIPFALYSLATQGHDSEIWDWIHEHKLDGVFDSASFGYVSFISALKLNGLDIELHGIFENLFYYFGGIGSLIWVFFRIKLAIIEGNNKSLENKKIQKEIDKMEQEMRHKHEEKERQDRIFNEQKTNDTHNKE